MLVGITHGKTQYNKNTMLKEGENVVTIAKTVKNKSQDSIIIKFIEGTLKNH